MVSCTRVRNSPFPGFRFRDPGPGSRAPRGRPWAPETDPGRPKPTLRKKERRSVRIGSRRSLRLWKASAPKINEVTTRTRTSTGATSGRSPICYRRDMIGTRSLVKLGRPSTVSRSATTKEGPGACLPEVVFVRGSTTATTASFRSDAFIGSRATARVSREYYLFRAMGIYCYLRR